MTHPPSTTRPLRHLALIMDGNGRWAEARGLPRFMGHQAGYETLKRIIRIAPEFAIEMLTFYVFSTENWKRPTDEVNFLMALPLNFVDKDLDELMQNEVRVVISGREGMLPEKTLEALHKVTLATAANSGPIVNLAFNYGGRAEIIDAVRALAFDVAAGTLLPQRIEEADLQAKLYQPELPDPDLIVRSAGELRLSNFLIWQSAYSEFYFSDKFWPDFDRDELASIVSAYRQRKRRFGGLIT